LYLHQKSGRNVWQFQEKLLYLHRHRRGGGGVSLFIYHDQQVDGEIKFDSHDVLELWADEMLQLVSEYRHDTEGTAQMVSIGHSRV